MSANGTRLGKRRLWKYIKVSLLAHAIAVLVLVLLILADRLTTRGPEAGVAPEPAPQEAADADAAPEDMSRDTILTNGAAEMPERPADVDLFQREH